MALDFLPFKEGDKLTPAVLNELVGSIRDGSIFTESAENVVGDVMTTVSDDTHSLEARVTILESSMPGRMTREQFTLTDLQESQAISKVPVVDSELVFLNGQLLSKTGVPLGFVGDYTLTNRTFAFNPEVYARIVAGDVLVVTYWYGV